MLDELRKQIEIRLQRLEENITVHKPILDRVKTGDEPGDIELSALAYMLQAFYSDVEAIFKLVARTIDNELPDTDSWHNDLLTFVGHETTDRPALISEELRQKLKEYLTFRHFSRYATAFMLDWEQMSSVVQDCEQTLKKLETELKEFLRAIDNEH